MWVHIRKSYSNHKLKVKKFPLESRSTSFSCKVKELILETKSILVKHNQTCQNYL